jgi:plasmid stability protein
VATIQVRDIPEDVYDEYRRQATAAGQSLQAYMRNQLVELARSRARKAAVLAELDVLLQHDGGTGVTVEQILSDLDADRER